MTSALETCLTKHASCPSAEDVMLPRRTLALQRPASGEIIVRLQENQVQEGRYIALSHCWGASQACITTSKTLREFKKSIRWTAMPKTFQDSIVFSMKLGIHYLWIDALCIIQDDPSDWQIESAKMADIYQNSFLTLAATASSSGLGGCFSIDQAPVVEYELTACMSLMQSRPIMVRKKLQHWTVPPTTVSIQLHPLLSRGWAFQERILSSTVLHFCGQELVWECNEEIVCECTGLSTRFGPKEQFYRLIHTDDIDLRNSGQSDTSSRHKERSTVSKKWHSIVEQYSSLQLTKETDRLPALSGLAKQASPILGDYFAGIWSDTLVSDLMWRVNKLDFEFGRPVKYTGPSWSWASVTGPISYWEDLKYEAGWLPPVILSLTEKAQSISVSCNVQAAGKNPFGEIASGALDITAYLQEARLGYMYTRTDLSFERLRHKELDPLKYELEIPETTSDPSIELSFFADYVLSEGPHRIDKDTPICLALVDPYVCLVLIRVYEYSQSSTNSRIFQRIGIVRSILPLLYCLDWMRGTTRISIRII